MTTLDIPPVSTSGPEYAVRVNAALEAIEAALNDLETDAAYTGAAATTPLVKVKVAGDAFNRGELLADGSYKVGDGTAAPSLGLKLTTTNTAVGLRALESRTTGVNNVADGYRALGSLTTGGQNTAVGHEAARGITVKNNGTYVGWDCFRDADAHDNVGVGMGAGFSPAGNAANKTTTGTRQVFVGKETGQASATQRNDVVCVGDQALIDADDATALGSAAHALHASSVALGKGSVTTAANQVMVGARDVEITNTAKGVVLKSPDGTRYRIQVANGGALSTVGA